MPTISQGKTYYAAELVFLDPESGHVAEAFWSMLYCTERGLRNWIRRNIDQRGVNPYRARIAQMTCDAMDDVYRTRGRPRDLRARPKPGGVKRGPLTLMRHTA